MGVQRAVQLAHKTAQDSHYSSIYTLGPLIHNPQALEVLRAEGIQSLDSGDAVQSLENSAVILRAHGVPPKTEQQLKDRGAQVVDATCPRVRASQKLAASFHKKNYRIFLAGDRNHGELIGIQAYARDSIIVADPDSALKEARNVKEADPDAKTVLIGQTTISLSEYLVIEKSIRTIFPDLVCADTICRATRERQDALRELSKKVDAIIVLGGKNSSNTKRLYQIARELCSAVWHLETIRDLDDDGIKRLRSCTSIGLSAGASTPEFVIQEAEKFLDCL